MKMFVWDDPYDVSFGSSMLIVVAETEDDARRLAMDGKSYSFCRHLKEGTPIVPNLGAPTRVVDIPCAEWHEWSE